jgi:hypothetical protein
VSYIVLDTFDKLNMSYPRTNEARRHELLKGLERVSVWPTSSNL